METAIDVTTTADLKTCFTALVDPRKGNAQLHLLLDMVVIAICATICGADHWTEVEAFGQAKEPWLRTFLELEHGIPAHDTFGRVFRHLDPEAFEACFVQWTQAIYKRTAGEVVPIDGKCLRRSHDGVLGKHAIYMVSAWAAENHLVLGQKKVDDKSNEITAIPELLRVLDVAGCIVTIDAMGTQKEIAQQIVTQEGDYVLALKENQPHLLEDVQNLFTWAANCEFQEMHAAHIQTVNKDHGRLEIRDCWTISDPSCIEMLADYREWANLQTVVRIRAERRCPDKTTAEERYYISSLPDMGAATAKRVLEAVRSHWGIENQLHWVLDMAFREDECRVRKGHGAENFAVIRHIALNLLKQDTRTRLGTHGKRLKAAWDTKYLERLLALQMR
jgi:predicted transposase YbfD/YdcC